MDNPTQADAPAGHLAALMDDRANAATYDWLATGFRRWLLQGGRNAPDANGRPVRTRHGLTLTGALGLPNTPERVRVAVRDERLNELATWLRDSEGWGPEPWPLAREIHRRACYFERRLWPVWWHLIAPPGHAFADERLLWHARHAAGLPLPGSPERYLQILRS